MRDTDNQTVDPIDTDLLTGLPTAAAARAWLDGAGPVHAMLAGLHRFQAVNMAYGASAGDGVLAEIARRIAAFAREELEGDCLVARLSGGAFFVASRHPESRERWQWLAEALAAGIARPLTVDGVELRLAPRIALLRGQEGEGGEDVLDRLDQALSTLQRHPARRLLWADGSHKARGRSEAQLEADLIGAMSRNEIALLFQPQYSVTDGRLVGAEALARWNHPVLGRVGAETLFAIATRGDHVAQLSRHIARRAMETAAGWPVDLRLSLNVTAEDLATPDFRVAMESALADAALAPDRLTLEITEQTLVADFESSRAALEQLAARGVQVAMDDFGTGFSNFRMLKALPINALKLDASLVRDIGRDSRDRAILRAIVQMAAALRLKVVAEGVESDDQLAILRTEGCETFQGFLRSGPVPAKEFP
ncbi:GGDEF domain-containing phosphodiesterase [Novosphingobium sp. ZN18A2]|uniref:GGDEF domain-containing phosphodiesterase n=1 Tax=Novosphingobium sp. ZN18A2 TaxID=3079861 RepID=UPI0030D116A2